MAHILTRCKGGGTQTRPAPAGGAFTGFPRSALKAMGAIFSAPLIVICLLLVSPSTADASADPSRADWAVMTGYGQSIPGWGKTSQRVETFDFVPRYNHLVFEDLGSSWYKGFHSTLVELPLHLITSPEVSAMVGVNLLACYTFTANQQWRPYIFGGGGPLYSFADISGMGAAWNGNYQFAIGLENRLDPDWTLLFELRYHHISNLGTEDPNVPLNSIKALIGVRF
jgi:lipid A 3-O-deacylase